VNIFPASSHFCDPLSFSCLPSLDVSLSSCIFAAVIQRLTITPRCVIILSFRCYSPTSRHHSTSRCHLAFRCCHPTVATTPRHVVTLRFAAAIQRLATTYILPSLCNALSFAFCCDITFRPHLLFAVILGSALTAFAITHHLRFAAVLFPSSASEFHTEPRGS